MRSDVLISRVANLGRHAAATLQTPGVKKKKKSRGQAGKSEWGKVILFLSSPYCAFVPLLNAALSRWFTFLTSRTLTAKINTEHLQDQKEQ